jgi:hypothetical protein
VEARTPHDTPPHLIPPSPTFGHSSAEREDTLKNIEKLSPNVEDIAGFEATQAKALKKSRVNKLDYQKALTVQLNTLVCSGDDNAPYALRCLLRDYGDSRLADAGPFAPALIERILAPSCPLSEALTKQDQAELTSLGVFLKRQAEEAQASESEP